MKATYIHAERLQVPLVLIKHVEQCKRSAGPHLEAFMEAQATMPAASHSREAIGVSLLRWGYRLIEKTSNQGHTLTVLKSADVWTPDEKLWTGVQGSVTSSTPPRPTPCPWSIRPARSCPDQYNRREICSS